MLRAARIGVELWCLGVACLILSFMPLPGAATIGAAADLFGVTGLLLTTVGAAQLPDR